MSGKLDHRKKYSMKDESINEKGKKKREKKKITLEVSWSCRWVYLVRDANPKFLTCMTFGSSSLLNLSSRVG